MERGYLMMVWSRGTRLACVEHWRYRRVGKLRMQIRAVRVRKLRVRILHGGTQDVNVKRGSAGERRVGGLGHTIRGAR